MSDDRRFLAITLTVFLVSVFAVLFTADVYKTQARYSYCEAVILAGRYSPECH